MSENKASWELNPCPTCGNPTMEQKDLWMKELARQKQFIEELVETSKKLIRHLEMILGDQKLSYTFHLKEILKALIQKHGSGK